MDIVSLLGPVLQLDVDATGLILQMGGSGLIGLVIGFAAKKVAKIIAIIVGLELVLFKFLESLGFLQVNWGEMGGVFENFATSAPGQAQSLVDTFVTTAGVGVGFAGGFYLGLKLG
ncbi:MAG: FUN14 domain-containing protein [Haloarculaceae archaeon]